MTIQINGRWRKYPPGWPLIGKVRTLWFFTMNLSTGKPYGYSYEEYEGWKFNTFNFVLFAIHWGSGYQTHKDNRERKNEAES